MRFKSFFLCIVVCVVSAILIPLASGWDWDNVKSFDDSKGEYGEITIVNALGLGDDIAKYTLEKNTDQCLVNCWAEGTVTFYEPNTLFEDMTFKNQFLLDKKVNYQFYIEKEMDYKGVS